MENSQMLYVEGSKKSGALESSSQFLSMVLLQELEITKIYPEENIDMP